MDRKQSNESLRTPDSQDLLLPVDLEAVITAYQSGDFRQAAEAATQYDQEYPDNEIVLSILGNSQQQLGLLDASISTMERINNLFPANYKNHNNLGLAYQESGKTVNAVTALRTAIQLNPKYGEAYYNLGNVLFELGNIDESIVNYEQAITLRPTHVSSYINLGIAKKQKGSLDEAKDCYEAAIKIDPNQAEPYYNNGILKLEAGDVKEAEDDFRKAIELRPNYSEACLNLGIIFKNQGNMQAAKEIFEEITKFNPNYSAAFFSLGNSLFQTGDLPGAITSYRRAVTADKNMKEAWWNLSLALLKNGDYEAGYRYYHNGFDLEFEHGPYKGRGKYLGNPELEWDGKKIVNYLIIWGEQGIGDEIMFSKFIKYLPRRISNIEIRVQRKMVNIFSEMFQHDIRIKVAARHEYIGSYAHIPIGNLAKIYWQRYFESEVNFSPSNDTGLKVNFSKRMVGITWRGGITAEAIENRSIDLDYFKKFFTLQRSNCQILVLQYDATIEELNKLRGVFKERLVTLEYDATANVKAWLNDIRGCDLLISADNSAVHLAGEFNIPTIVLLPTDSDYRWGREGCRTPLYESVRLIRCADKMNYDEINRQIDSILVYQ